MTAETSLAEIEQAIHQFYHNNQRYDLNQWLTSLQHSPEAWNLPWQLMSNSTAPEVQYFGASCLRVKLERFWHECPADQQTELRSRILQEIVKFSSGPKIVLTRLCSCLALYTLQSTPDVWPDSVSSIIQTFQNMQASGNNNMTHVLLEVLRILPEEYGTFHFRSYRQAIVHSELKNSLPMVLTILNECLNSDNKVLTEQSLRCLTSWVEFGIDISQFECFITPVFNMLNNDILFDTAIETLEAMFEHPENYRYPKSVEKVLPHVLTLRGMVDVAIKNQDTEKCQSLCKLIFIATDNNTDLLVKFLASESQSKQLAIDVISLQLQCTNLPGFYPVDESVSDLSFTFWYNFQDSLLRDEVILPVMQTAFQIYMSLVEVLLRKAHYPSDENYAHWTADEKELHRCYRQDIADTFMYSYTLLNDALLQNLYQLLGTYCSKDNTQILQWQDVEAVLFAMTSISDCIYAEETQYLPNIFSLLVHLPTEHIYVSLQALNLIGSFAEWLSGHPDIFGHALPLVINCISNPTLATNATLALKELVRENQQHVLPYAESILVASQQVLEKEILAPKEVSRLFACLGYVTSTLPVDHCMQCVSVILGPHIEQLQVLGNSDVTPTAKPLILNKLDMLSWLFTSLNIHWDEEGESTTPVKARTDSPQPILLILQKLLPIFSNSLQHWMAVEEVIDAVCSLLQRALRTVMNECGLLHKELSEFTCQMFSMVAYPCILPLAKQLLLLCANDEAFKGTSHVLFQVICNKCLLVFQHGTREYPELVEGFMTFLSQILKKDRLLLGHESCNAQGLFQIGMNGIAMAEHSAVKSSASFLSEYITCASQMQLLKDIILASGLHLTEQLFLSISGTTPRNLIENITDVLFSLNKHFQQDLVIWMKTVTEREEFPNKNTSLESKQKFSAAVLRAKGNKRKMKEVTQEYSLLWRGLLGTEYAAQTVHRI